LWSKSLGPRARPFEDVSFWSNAGFHLIEAGRRDQLRERLEDYRYLLRKLQFAGVDGVLGDFRLLAEPEDTQRIENIIRASAQILASYPNQIDYKVSQKALAPAPPPYLRAIQ
jgi:hypothetical protein